MAEGGTATPRHTYGSLEGRLERLVVAISKAPLTFQLLDDWLGAHPNFEGDADTVARHISKEAQSALRPGTKNIRFTVTECRPPTVKSEAYQWTGGIVAKRRKGGIPRMPTSNFSIANAPSRLTDIPSN